MLIIQNLLVKYMYSIREHHERFYKNVTIIIYNFKKIIEYNKIYQKNYNK